MQRSAQFLSLIDLNDWRLVALIMMTMAVILAPICRAQSGAPTIEFKSEMQGKSLRHIDLVFTNIANATAKKANWEFYKPSGFQLIEAGGPPSQIYDIRCVCEVCYLRNPPSQETVRQTLGNGQVQVSGSLTQVSADSPNAIPVTYADTGFDLEVQSATRTHKETRHVCPPPRLVGRRSTAE